MYLQLLAMYLQFLRTFTHNKRTDSWSFTGSVVVLNSSRDEEIDGSTQESRVEVAACFKAQPSFAVNRRYPHTLSTAREAVGS